MIEKITKGIVGFFVGGWIGLFLALIIPLICFMGMDWTFNFMFGPIHTIIFRVFVIIGGILGILIAIIDIEE